MHQLRPPDLVSGATLAGGELPIEAQHEHPNGAGKAFARSLGRSDNFPDRDSFPVRDLLQRIPEFWLEADACLAEAGTHAPIDRVVDALGALRLFIGSGSRWNSAKPRTGARCEYGPTSERFVLPLGVERARPMIRTSSPIRGVSAAKTCSRRPRPEAGIAIAADDGVAASADRVVRAAGTAPRARGG